MQKKTIEVIVGKKFTGSLDPSKLSLGRPAPLRDDAEVSGRALVTTVVECPHCGALNHVVADTLDTRAYECWRCGGVFYF
jgi:DNA-directed RNA polymerase subunit RPC12/RpoP